MTETSAMSELAPDRPYPWQQDQWRHLQRARKDAGLSHAYLLEGIDGLGKRDFARALAGALLCREEREDGGACGHCRDCQQLRAGSHPDLMRVAPADGKRSIVVDQVRELNEALGMRSHHGGYRIAILQPAERLTASAANSLLKTLEEPGPGTLLLLVTAHPAGLPATVRSRCQRMTFAVPRRSLAESWLSEQGRANAAPLLGLAGDAPLMALDLDEQAFLPLRQSLVHQLQELVAHRLDPVRVAGDWAEHDAGAIVRWLAVWCMDLLRLRITGSGARLAQPDLEGELGRLAPALDLRGLFSYLDLVQRMAPALQGGANRRQLLELLLIPWRYRLSWPLSGVAEDLVKEGADRG